MWASTARELPENVDVLIVGNGPRRHDRRRPALPVLASRLASLSAAANGCESGRPTASRPAASRRSRRSVSRAVSPPRPTASPRWRSGSPTPPIRRASSAPRTARTTPRHQRVPAPHRQPGAGARTTSPRSTVNSPTRRSRTTAWSSSAWRTATRAEYPVDVTLGTRPGRAKARSAPSRQVRGRRATVPEGVRESIGCTLDGDQANHAWGVMDVLAVTDFPDIRTKCAIQSRRRQHPAHPPRGRIPVPHVRRPRRGGRP